ncbi:MAG TPA: cbb3-type cytochrome c oxidase subunit I, partial [Edaphobacter sp.]|nr:cbb3-type cytochrome c oxidase subunit I [Edaphobacter sp.]
VLAQPILDEYLHNTFFVVGHFHLIMAMAGVFGLFSATYYWFPLLTATSRHPDCMLSERLGRWHFWLTLIAAYGTFLPMYFTGLAGEPRHYAQLTGIPNTAGKMLAATLPLNLHITYGAIGLALAQLLFLANIVLSLRRRTPAPPNPWQATTLEWHPGLHPSAHPDASEAIVVLRAPCDYRAQSSTSTTEKSFFLTQWSHNSIHDIKPE